MIRKLLMLAGILSFVASAHAATVAQPQVAFIGDAMTSQWQASPQFQANRDWLPFGFTTSALECCQGTTTALTELRQIIASGQRPIIHLMVAQGDADGYTVSSDPQAAVLGYYGQNFKQIIQTAQAAKLTVIVGLEPFSLNGNVAQLNDWTKLYCFAHNIPVIDYASALNGVGFAANLAPSAPPPVFYTTTPTFLGIPN